MDHPDYFPKAARRCVTFNLNKDKEKWEYMYSHSPGSDDSATVESVALHFHIANAFISEESDEDEDVLQGLPVQIGRLGLHEDFSHAWLWKICTDKEFRIMAARSEAAAWSVCMVDHSHGERQLLPQGRGGSLIVHGSRYD